MCGWDGREGQKLAQTVTTALHFLLETEPVPELGAHLSAKLIGQCLGCFVCICQPDTARVTWEEKHRLGNYLHRIASGQVCGLSSCLMIGVGKPSPLDMAPPLSEWSCAV